MSPIDTSSSSTLGSNPILRRIAGSTVYLLDGKYQLTRGWDYFNLTLAIINDDQEWSKQFEGDRCNLRRKARQLLAELDSLSTDFEAQSLRKYWSNQRRARKTKNGARGLFLDAKVASAIAKLSTPRPSLSESRAPISSGTSEETYHSDPEPDTPRPSLSESRASTSSDTSEEAYHSDPGANTPRDSRATSPATSLSSLVEEDELPRAGYRVRQIFGPFSDDSWSSIGSLANVQEPAPSSDYISGLLRDFMAQESVIEGNRRLCLRVIVRQDPPIVYEVIPREFPIDFDPFAAEPDESARSILRSSIELQSRYCEAPTGTEEAGSISRPGAGGSIHETGRTSTIAEASLTTELETAEVGTTLGANYRQVPASDLYDPIWTEHTVGRGDPESGSVMQRWAEGSPDCCIC